MVCYDRILFKITSSDPEFLQIPGKNCHGIVPMKFIFIQCSSNPESPEIYPVLFILNRISNL